MQSSTFCQQLIAPFRVMLGIAKLDVQTQTAHRAPRLDAKRAGGELVQGEIDASGSSIIACSCASRCGSPGGGEEVDQQDQLARGPANEFEDHALPPQDTAAMRALPPRRTILGCHGVQRQGVDPAIQLGMSAVLTARWRCSRGLLLNCSLTSTTRE